MRAQEIRDARELLQRKRLRRPKPADLVRAAKELGWPLAETLAFIMRAKQGAQNQQAQRREILARVKE